MEIITSVNNQRVKDVANLKQKKYRTETGAFFAEGLRAVIEAVQFADLSELFFIKTEENKLTEIIKTAEEKGVRLYCVDEKVMAKLSDTKTPQGVLALIKMPEDSLQKLNPGTSSDNRASMGSLFHLPVIQDVFPEEALTWCYRHGYEPAATALKNAQNMYKADLSKKMAFIFGNEANGVAEELQAAAETRLFIPMAGQAESMNVAMAAGIILFEGLRQRKFFR